MTGEKQVLVVPEDKFYQATGMYYEEWHPLYLANNSGKELEGREAEDFKKGMVFVKEQLSQVIALQDLVLKKENKIGDLEEKEKDLHAQLEEKGIEYKKMKDAVAYKDQEITRREMEVEHNKAGLEKERERLQSSDAAKLEDKLKVTEQELQDAHKEAVEELDRTKGAYAKKVKNIVALQRIKYEKELGRFKKESSDLENKLIGLLGTNEPLYKLIGELQVNPEDIKAQPPSDEGKVRIQIVKSNNLKMATIPQNSKVIFYVDADGTNPFIARGRLECGFVYFSLSDLITDEPETDKAALVNLVLKDIAEGRRSAHIVPYSAETIVNILEKRISETKMPETEAVKLLKAKATAAETELTNLKKGSAAMMRYLNTLNEKKSEETVKELKESYEMRIDELEQRLNTTNATDIIELQRQFVPLFLKWQDAEGAEKQKLEDEVMSFFKKYGNNIPHQISNLSHMFEAYCPKEHFLSGKHLDLSSGTIIDNFRYLIKKCEPTALQSVDDKKLEKARDSYAWYDTGIEFDRTGKISEAIEAYSKGIELEHKFHRTPTIISLLEHRAEERQARLESIENQGDIWYYVGKKLETLGILDDALKAYKKALFCVPMDLNFKESKELLEKKLNEGEKDSPRLHADSAERLNDTLGAKSDLPASPVYVGVLDVPERGYCVQAKLPDGTEVTYRTDGLFVFSSDLIGTDSKPLNVPKEYIKILKQIWAEHRNDYIKKFHPESLNIEEATAPKVASPTPPAVVQDENYVYQFVDGFWSGKLVVHEVQQDKSLKYVGEYTAFGGVKNVKKIKGAEIKDLPKEVVSNIVNVYLKQMQSAKEMPIQLGDVSGVVRQQGEKIEILYKNLTYTVKDDALLDKDNNVVTEPGALKLFSAYRYQKSQESQERSWLEDALGI